MIINRLRFFEGNRNVYKFISTHHDQCPCRVFHAPAKPVRLWQSSFTGEIHEQKGPRYPANVHRNPDNVCRNDIRYIFFPETIQFYPSGGAYANLCSVILYWQHALGDLCQAVQSRVPHRSTLGIDKSGILLEES